MTDSYEWVEGLLQISQIQAGAAESQRAALLYVIEPDPAVRGELIRTRNAAALSAKAIMDTYRREVRIMEYDTEEDRLADLGGIDSILAAWAEYDERVSRMMRYVDEGRPTEAAGSGDLTVLSNVTSGDEFGIIGRHCDLMITRIRALVGSVHEFAADIARSAGDLRSSIEQSSQETKLIVESVHRVSEDTKLQNTDVDVTGRNMSLVASEVSAMRESV